jgi:hypothetical protein
MAARGMVCQGLEGSLVACTATAPRLARRYRAELWGDVADHPLFDGMLLRRVDGLAIDA